MSAHLCMLLLHSQPYLLSVSRGPPWILSYCWGSDTCPSLCSGLCLISGALPPLFLGFYPYQIFCSSLCHPDKLLSPLNHSLLPTVLIPKFTHFQKINWGFQRCSSSLSLFWTHLTYETNVPSLVGTLSLVHPRAFPLGCLVLHFDNIFWVSLLLCYSINIFPTSD